MDTIETLTDLFLGNPRAVGTEEGGCERLDIDEAGLGEWRAAVWNHFHGERTPIGVYPMVNDDQGRWWVRWGCIDYDMGEPDSLIHAWNTQRVLERFGITSWIEVSRSKGHHLWVFASEWVPAATMRRALGATQQMLGIPLKEVNPKQETLGLDKEGRPQLGNYVRLPYPGALGDNAGGITADGRREVLFGNDPAHLFHLFAEQFAREAHASRVSAEQLAPLVERYQPPPEAAAFDTPPPEHLTGLVSQWQPHLNGLAYTIWRDGPSAGSDRSTTLARLAYKIAEQTTPPIPPEACFAFLEDLDRRIGKFVGRTDRDEQLEKMVARAYGR
jgi:hypothetical protein